MRMPLLVSSLLVVVFWAAAILQSNYEFLLYAGVMLVLVAILHYSDRLFAYRTVALWGFSAWLLMHLLGGLLVIGGEVLYKYMIIDLIAEPYNILKYDQVVHVFAYIVFAMLVASIVDHIAAADANHWVLGIITVLAATGVGGLNEIIEFSTTVLFESTGVGGYVNTALDMCANLIGAVIGVFIFRKLER